MKTRNFCLNLFYFFLILFLTTSCIATPTPTSVSSPTPTPKPTLTATDIPINTAVPTIAITETPTIQPTARPCIEILNPLDKAIVPAQGPFDFSWKGPDNAKGYSLAIGPKDWFPTIFTTTDSFLTRYMEIFTENSPYEWKITALDAQGNEICHTDPITFEKSANVVATPSFKIASSSFSSPAGTEEGASQQTSDNNSGNSNNQNSTDNNADASMYVGSRGYFFDDKLESDCGATFIIFFRASHPFLYTKMMYGVNTKNLTNSIDYISSTGENPPLEYTMYSARFPAGILKSGDTLYYQAWHAVQFPNFVSEGKGQLQELTCP